jgi:DTW domain-containing protein YfiP
MGDIQTLLHTWLALPKKGFSRMTLLGEKEIQCDCSGLINLLCDHLSISKPYALERPRAVHYFAILQEIGSSHISQIKPWNLMAWRKDNVPKSGDSGHLLLVVSEPTKLDGDVYRVSVIDATKIEDGLAQREICVHTNAEGRLVGVQLHLSESKVKRTPIYHAPLMNKRYCFGCGVPRKVCLCDQVEPSAVAPNIVILRHPEERKKTLSTVSLIKQRYPAVLVKEGETFSPLRYKQLALLFPDGGNGVERSAVKQRWADSGSSTKDRTADTLLLLDATWRKAKRMLHENDWLAALPRVSITPKVLSDYLLRKVPDANALSTVEVFAMVEEDAELQDLFRVFMQKQIELMGSDKYNNNYRDHINYLPTSDLRESE